MSDATNVIETIPKNKKKEKNNLPLAPELQQGKSKRPNVELSFFYFSQNSLVRLLTAKERDKARSVFLGLGLDKDGMITRAECRQAQPSWFQKLNKDSQSCNVR